VFLLLIMVLLAPSPAVAQAGEVEVSVGDAASGPQGEASVAIELSGATDLGAANIWLEYDSSVVEVTEVMSGDLGEVTYGIDNEDGVTRMVWFSGTGKTGDFVFAQIALRAAGATGGSSTLGVQVQELVDINGTEVPHAVRDGRFTIEGDGVAQAGQYTLVVSSTVGGSVSSPGEGSFEYDAGESVTLVATPETGSEFEGWEGDVEGDVGAPSITVTMDRGRSVSAVFSQTEPGGVPTEDRWPGFLPGRWGVWPWPMAGLIGGAVAIIIGIVLLIRLVRRHRYD
jgi:hypothetical protein